MDSDVKDNYNSTQTKNIKVLQKNKDMPDG